MEIKVWNKFEGKNEIAETTTFAAEMPDIEEAKYLDSDYTAPECLLLVKLSDGEYNFDDEKSLTKDMGLKYENNMSIGELAEICFKNLINDSITRDWIKEDIKTIGYVNTEKQFENYMALGKKLGAMSELEELQYRDKFDSAILDISQDGDLILEPIKKNSTEIKSKEKVSSIPSEPKIYFVRITCNLDAYKELEKNVKKYCIESHSADNPLEYTDIKEISNDLCYFGWNFTKWKISNSMDGYNDFARPVMYGLRCLNDINGCSFNYACIEVGTHTMENIEEKWNASPSDYSNNRLPMRPILMTSKTGLVFNDDVLINKVKENQITEKGKIKNNNSNKDYFGLGIALNSITNNIKDFSERLMTNYELPDKYIYFKNHVRNYLYDALTVNNQELHDTYGDNLWDIINMYMTDNEYMIKELYNDLSKENKNTLSNKNRADDLEK